jgi:serine/threonine protein kinase/lipopolysaccharide biosynthesis regulator YciM
MKCPKCQADNPDHTLFCGKCGTKFEAEVEVSSSPTKTVETPTEELTRGSIIADRYEVIEELGKGGMGKVYRVEDKKIKEEIALKLIKPEIAADKKTIERFSNELKFARKIAHRNVCKMYDLGEEEGTYYITMEYVPGEDLKSFIRRSRQLTIGTAISLAKQVSEGLLEAHRLGVVHRDLKPQNVMIDKEGNARIMDFGVARSVTGKGITGAGVMIGTPEYMSPEQVEGKEADQRSDIYSLGIIMYEMLTGRVPFEGDTAFAIGVKQKSESPKDPREFNSQISDDLSRVILKCLEKDKEKRFQSAGEVRSELSNIEQGIPTTERVIPKKEPITSKEITVTFSVKKLFVPALVVIAVIIAAVVIIQLLPRKKFIPVSTDKPTLAVVYFKNNTGDPNFEHWRSTLSDLLITDLTQSKYIRVLSGDQIFDILSELDQLEAKTYSTRVLKEVASRGRATHILQGDFSRAGDTFRINTVLKKASTMESIDSEIVEGEGEKSFYTMVDELTRRLKASFQLTEEQITGDIDRHVGEITTSSPEALKYFSEGSRHYRKGENRQAVDLLEKAVKIDPEFAMAYRNLAGAYSNLGYPTKWREFNQKALELIDHVSDRERLRIQGDFYRRSEKTYDQAFAALNKLLELYPDDWIGNNSLGMIYLNLEEWDKAAERYEVNVQNRVEAMHSYVNLALTYEYRGMYDKAREVLNFYLKNIGESARVHREISDTYLYQGKYDLALAEVNKAISLEPDNFQNINYRGDIFFLKGDLAKAEEDYLKLTLNNEVVARAIGIVGLTVLNILQGRFEEAMKQCKIGIQLAEEHGEKVGAWQLRTLLTYIQIQSGDPEKALEELDEMWDTAEEEKNLSWQRFVWRTRGIAYVGMNMIDKAQGAANELKKLLEQALNKKLMRDYHYLMGLIELQEKNYSGAIESLDKALALYPYHQDQYTLIFLDSLALAYFKSGELEKAQEHYERITQLMLPRYYYPDIYAKSFYMLGRISEQKGWTGKAIENYEKFLDLWKNADPGIAEVEDAKKKLEGLKD